GAPALGAVGHGGRDDLRRRDRPARAAQCALVGARSARDAPRARRTARVIRSAAASAALALLTSAAPRAVADRERAGRAVAQTGATQLPNGLFRYDFDSLAAEPSGDDNIVRQAGALFALAAYLADTGDRSVAAPIEAGLDALAQRSLPIGTGTAQS